jgi:hypothetical protein
MVNIGLLIFCFVFGIILRQSGRLPEKSEPLGPQAGREYAYAGQVTPRTIEASG